MAFRERILGLVRGSINAKGQLTHDPVRRQSGASLGAHPFVRSPRFRLARRSPLRRLRAEPPDLQLHLPVLLHREADPAAMDAWAGRAGTRSRAR